MINESTIYGGLYWNIVKVRGIILVENELGTVASILFLELIKKEGEEAAKKKKEILAERITPLPTLNGMSKFLELRFSIESGLNNSNSFWIIQFNSLNHVAWHHIKFLTSRWWWIEKSVPGNSRKMRQGRWRKIWLGSQGHQIRFWS